MGQITAGANSITWSAGVSLAGWRGDASLTRQKRRESLAKVRLVSGRVQEKRVRLARRKAGVKGCPRWKGGRGRE